MSTALAPSPSLESASSSPFALTDDHEFPESPGKKLNDTLTGILVDVKTALVPAVPPPALPGTPASPYRHCPCLGALPGRVCSFCHGTKWTKLCPRCEGDGRIDLNIRKGAERSQPCGFCGGRGIRAASLTEVEEATKAAEEFAAGPDGQAAIIDDSTAAPEFHRAVKLPGIGVTATKRVGTLAARQRERTRLEKRKKKRKTGKAAGATATN
jgi:hypothetical protein